MLLEAAGRHLTTGMLLGIPPKKSQNFDFFHEAGDDEPYIGLMLFVSHWKNEFSSTRYRDLHPLRVSSIQFASRLVMGVRGRRLSFLM